MQPRCQQQWESLQASSFKTSSSKQTPQAGTHSNACASTSIGLCIAYQRVDVSLLLFVSLDVLHVYVVVLDIPWVLAK